MHNHMEDVAEALHPPQCIITGCKMVIQEEGKSLWGDLHAMGSTLVFNGVLDHRNEPMWSFGDTPTTGRVVVVHGFYYEKRGVIVVNKGGVSFNDAAASHITNWSF
jgi:hypothetical protein